MSLQLKALRVVKSGQIIQDHFKEFLWIHSMFGFNLPVSHNKWGFIFPAKALFKYNTAPVYLACLMMRCTTWNTKHTINSRWWWCCCLAIVVGPNELSSRYHSLAHVSPLLNFISSLNYVCMCFKNKPPLMRMEFESNLNWRTIVSTHSCIYLELAVGEIIFCCIL